MSRSTLSIKISLSELVERLNDDGCVNVIRLLQNELGHDTLNTMVNKIIMQLTQNLSNESLIKIEKTIKDKYSQHFTQNTLPTTKKNNVSADTVLFPLLRLPNDLILKTSLFLHEKDIFPFEQCCRLFYKMINNTSYLTQCNNFKEFFLTKKRLNEMRQDKYSFFKYSKANKLTCNLSLWQYHYGPASLFDTDTSLVAAVNDLETTIDKMKNMVQHKHDNWWIGLCKSISILNLHSGTNIGALLSAIPIDIIFNPLSKESCLKRIEMSDYSPKGARSIWNNYMKKFEEKYLECEKKWKQQGLTIKSLECVKYPPSTCLTKTKLRYIHAKQKLYWVLEWNKNIDDKILRQLKNQFDHMKHDDQNQKQFKEKYLLIREKWLD